jgi:RimJ/RimL family protein N-acetyltransferase
MNRASSSGQNAAAYDRLVNDTVILRAGATPSAPALALRPWCMEDIAALVEVCRDPALRHWTSSAVENEADAMQWVQGQERGWAAGDRFGFAVLETRSDSAQGQLVGNVILKELVPGKPSAEVGYWTAAHARGRGVAPALWRFSPAGPSTPWGPKD